MKRLAKPEGVGNIVVEEVEVPRIGPDQVLIRAERTLISRGSEIWRRYNRPEAIPHSSMGYSLAGRVVEVGDRVAGFSPGDRVAASAPHAEYVAVEIGARPGPSVVLLPDTLSMEAATFWPLSTSSVLWVDETGAGPGDTMAILGQGLVGSGCMQVAKAGPGARVIAVDALPLRCQLARSLGADEVVDAQAEDPVEAVRRLSGGGAQIVVEAVGGRAGARAFAQAQDMVARGGLLQVLGLYEDEPLPLDSSKIQGRRLIGGYLDPQRRTDGSRRALELLASGRIRMDEMVTHRFVFAEGKAAFDLLYENLQETMAVILVWD
ncbi:MAG: zinc-binding dehydrogenase [Candidatus Latescibacteria bacterium]|nr:zinc-binding dehydrogenase [Candidatus Latescibacterota bacterium]